jgi:adenosylhomocysteinase
MTIQTAVLIETLAHAGRRCPLGVVQHLLHPGPCRGGHRARQASPVFAIKGETLEEYWDYADRIFHFEDGGRT